MPVALGVVADCVHWNVVAYPVGIMPAAGDDHRMSMFFHCGLFRVAKLMVVRVSHSIGSSDTSTPMALKSACNFCIMMSGNMFPEPPVGYAIVMCSWPGL